jgi:zinc protease
MIQIAIESRAFFAFFTVVTGLFPGSAAWAALPIEHWTQSSGARVYLVQSPGIPMVDVQIDFDAGARRDPVDKAGLASIMASSTANGVRAQGTQAALDENALSDAWADLGATFSGTASGDRMTFSLRSLTYPDLLPKAAALVGRQLGQPAFAQAAWLRDRPKLIATLKEADTRPATVTGQAFNRSVYGTHPYGREMTPATLERISVQDMQALHAQAIRPCYAQVSIVGAVDRAQADALVRHIFEQLPTQLSAGLQDFPQTSPQAVAGCPHLPAVPEVQALQRAQAQRIAFASAQAHVLLGQPGFKRNDPDFFALTVGNHILGGGGFTSRLNTEVRQKRGLSYSVYSYFAPGLHAGAFTIGLQTRPDQADQALQLVQEVLTQFVVDGPTQAELQAAKDNLIGSFPLLIDSNRKLLGNVANIAWNGLPLTYLDTWTERVQRITVQDIRNAFARKLQPQTMVSVVLGAPETAGAVGAVK